MNQRYITNKPCPKCGIKSSALALQNGSGSIMAGSPVTYHPQTGDLVLPCRGCGDLRRASQVRGTFSKTHQCGAKCTSSTGFKCECSCGGKNHGAGHA